jgi:DNA-binding transcriptional regulator YdaS (Cro superfamily)
VSATSVNLLVAAAEIVGGNRALARRLGIGETLLAQFMNDSRQLPDLLLLRAVDIILSDRQARLPAVRG